MPLALEVAIVALLGNFWSFSLSVVGERCLCAALFCAACVRWLFVLVVCARCVRSLCALVVCARCVRSLCALVVCGACICAQDPFPHVVRDCATLGMTKGACFFLSFGLDLVTTMDAGADFEGTKQSTWDVKGA